MRLAIGWHEAGRAGVCVCGAKPPRVIHLIQRLAARHPRHPRLADPADKQTRYHVILLVDIADRLVYRVHCTTVL